MKALLACLFLVVSQPDDSWSVTTYIRGPEAELICPGQKEWILEGKGEDLTLRPCSGGDSTQVYKGFFEPGVEESALRLRNDETGNVLKGRLDRGGVGYIVTPDGHKVKFRPGFGDVHLRDR